ncbi:TetR/AcrR family transcriptional regulator [Caulobacter sp. AP07]|uniref:TetR/AcrR family transcriptional regulator n=1 Tax=Caulobacter sp. AP07 TaxID=1144304 RepID=UPI0003173B0C|nr:hypothetical protein [Caulobacter sp. AP07]
MARALVDHPGATYQDLAPHAGISRRTLYRVAASREALLDLLRQEAHLATARALDAAGLADGDPQQVLAALTLDFLEDAALYSFWIEEGAPRPRPGQMPPADPVMDDYRARMIGFFRRGQATGAFRDDLGADWLLRTYDALLMAAGTLSQESSADPSSLRRLVMASFIAGAGRG